jgi:hypothetical protein
MSVDPFRIIHLSDQTPTPVRTMTGRLVLGGYNIHEDLVTECRAGTDLRVILHALLMNDRDSVLKTADIWLAPDVPPEAQPIHPNIADIAAGVGFDPWPQARWTSRFGTRGLRTKVWGPTRSLLP